MYATQDDVWPKIQKLRRAAKGQSLFTLTLNVELPNWEDDLWERVDQFNAQQDMAHRKDCVFYASGLERRWISANKEILSLVKMFFTVYQQEGV